MSRKIQGYDYVNHCPVAMAAAEWQRKYREHARRHDDGETFFTPRWNGKADARPRIAAEAYGYVPPTKEQRE